MLTCTIGGREVRLDRDGSVDVPCGETLSVTLASGGHWYGHGFSHVQPYPLEAGSVANPAYAVNNIQCPAWMCSAGWVLFADTLEVLDVRINEGGSGLLTVRCEKAGFPLRVFRAGTLPQANAKFLAHLGWPNKPPSDNLLADSIFCTWTQYPRCISQARILDMARQIRSRSYPCSTIIIDDRWESCFGELEFSAAFPDPRAMVRELHALGFAVWLWVTPFVNEEAATFADLTRRKVLVPRGDGQGAAMLKWWGGTAGLVDLTAPAGREWFKEQLTRLKNDVGVDGFKIDGGDFKYQPPLTSSAWHDYRGPSGYSDALLSIFEEIAPNACETRTAWLSQKRSIVWRQGGKDSHWGLDNGLAAMVTLALQVSLLGYDIFIPDMIPGRVQTMSEDFPLPSDELMVRWTEATALMPLMQFSYFPWNYAAATEQAVRGFANLHKAIGFYIAESAARRTEPLLRPLWYDAPEAAELYLPADEFMLGPNLVAAPVVAEGVVARDVTLPPGAWRDAWTGETLDGGRHERYPAPCPGMPIFVRAEDERLFAAAHGALSAIARGTVKPGVTTTEYRAGLNRDLSVTG
jgi:myogenesis-regulating glycosidase